MEKLIICPKCGKPTVKERLVYKIEIKEISLKDRAEEQKKYYQHFGEPYSGDCGILPSLWIVTKPNQLVYECSSCGHTEVYNI